MICISQMRARRGMELESQPSVKAESRLPPWSPASEGELESCHEWVGPSGICPSCPSGGITG